jgi:RNA polymerase sigma-70 factor, ECF subfamily
MMVTYRPQRVSLTMKTERASDPGREVPKAEAAGIPPMTALLDGVIVMDAMEASPGNTSSRSDAAFNWQSCLEQVREGDQDAARELVRFLYPLVLKIVRYHLPRRTAEEDLAQIVFMRMFQHLRTYNGQSPLEHWVSRIAVNTCLNELRSEKARPELRWADLGEAEERVVALLSSSPDALDPAEDFAARELAQQLLSMLRPDDRLIIQMMHMDGCSVEEVHQKTGWSRVMIKVRAFRARQKLRKQYEQLTKDRP